MIPFYPYPWRKQPLQPFLEPTGLEFYRKAMEEREKQKAASDTLLNERKDLVRSVREFENEEAKNKWLYKRNDWEILKDISLEPNNASLIEEYKDWLTLSLENRKLELENPSPWTPKLIQDIELKLGFLEAQDNNDLEKMKELAASLNPSWLAIVSRPPVINCGRPDPEHDASTEKWWNWAKSSHPEDSWQEWRKRHPAFKMEFVCTKKWNEMNPTENKMVRFCGDCQKNVYFCKDIVEARELGNQGCCIGIDVGVDSSEKKLVGELSIFGRPKKEHVEENKKNGLPDDVSAARIKREHDLKMNGKYAHETDKIAE